LPERVPTPNANDCKPAGEKEIAMMRLYHGGQSIPDTYKRLRGHVAARVLTPLASDANAPGYSAGRQGSQSLSVVVRVPTPTVCGNYNRKGVSEKSGDGLATVVKRIPTPTTQDASNNGAPSQMERNTKPLNAEVGGPLNPPWVEWLMGWPIGWTDLHASATDKFQQWCASHGLS
jgi:hypothetical protein